MVSKKELCERIEGIHPDIGECGVDFDVNFDKEAKAWAVDFHQGRQHLRTFIEDNEADSCLSEERCLSLALQIGQLRVNFEKYIHEHALEAV